MAFRRRRRKRRKPRLRRTRRRFRRHRGRRGRRTSSLVLRSPVYIPDNLFIKLKWSEVRNTDANVFNRLTYSLNGPFDPTETISPPPPSTQPLGWDQWSAFYNRYECFGSTIKVLFSNNIASLCGHAIMPANDVGGSMDFNEIKTNPYGRYAYTSGINGKAFARLKSYMSVKKLEGRQTKSVNYVAEVTTLPQKRKYWVVISQSMDLTTFMDVFYDTQITYYIRFFDRKSRDAS